MPSLENILPELLGLGLHLQEGFPLYTFFFILQHPLPLCNSQGCSLVFLLLNLCLFLYIHIYKQLCTDNRCDMCTSVRLYLLICQMCILRTSFITHIIFHLFNVGEFVGTHFFFGFGRLIVPLSKSMSIITQNKSE